jgi:hypothetical protein
MLRYIDTSGEEDGNLDFFRVTEQHFQTADRQELLGDADD